MKTIDKLKNTKGYENLEEVLGKELGSLIYSVVADAEKWDKEIDIFHKHVSIVQNTMTNINRDPVKIQLDKCLDEIANVGKENYEPLVCPECLNLVSQDELDMFGGLCEECNL